MNSLFSINSTLVKVAGGGHKGRRTKKQGTSTTPSNNASTNNNSAADATNSGSGLMKWVKNKPLKTTAGVLGGAFALHHLLGSSSDDTNSSMSWGNRDYGSDSSKSPYSAS